MDRIFGGGVGGGVLHDCILAEDEAVCVFCADAGVGFCDFVHAV
jgi:hypothetical protein